MRWPARALGHFQEADAIMARNPRRTVKAPRIMEEVYRVMLQGMMARGWQPPRTRVSVEPAAAVLDRGPIRNHLMARTVHIIGAGLAGLAAAVKLAPSQAKVVVHEATAYPGGRCRSYFDRTIGMTIDNGNHLVLSGNHAVVDFAEAIGSAAGLVGPAAAEFPFVDLASDERWTAADQRRAAVVDFRQEPPRSRHAPRRISAAVRDCCGSRPTCRSPMSSTARARCITGWCIRCCWRR